MLDKPLPLDQLLLPIFLCVGSLVLPLQALINSGAQNSLLDEAGLAMQARCSLEPLPSPFTATALDSRCIAWVTHKMVPVTLITFGNNLEQI